jgi:hypothetical protein|tara:strand:+ start:126 stop:302 length:177 start_codon:yes stop_codon:yes gene_type:complete
MKNSAANKLKQVPVGYLVIGIDVHKEKHAAVVMTQDLPTVSLSSITPRPILFNGRRDN